MLFRVIRSAAGYQSPDNSSSDKHTVNPKAYCTNVIAWCRLQAAVSSKKTIVKTWHSRAILLTLCFLVSVKLVQGLGVSIPPETVHSPPLTFSGMAGAQIWDE